jgi:hypothetical protein
MVLNLKINCILPSGSPDQVKCKNTKGGIVVGYVCKNNQFQ